MVVASYSQSEWKNTRNSVFMFRRAALGGGRRCSAYATSHSQIENILLVKTGIFGFHNIGFQFQTHTGLKQNDQYQISRYQEIVFKSGIGFVRKICLYNYTVIGGVQRECTYSRHQLEYYRHCSPLGAVIQIHQRNVTTLFVRLFISTYYRYPLLETY